MPAVDLSSTIHFASQVYPIMMTHHKGSRSGMWNDDVECEKCKRLIDAAFGPNKPMPEDYVTGLTRPDSKIVRSDKCKDSERNHNVVENKILKAVTLQEGDEKLAQKIEKIEETPLVDAEQKQIDELNTYTRASLWFSDGDIIHTMRELRGEINIYDELANRCINTPRSQIDNKLVKEMEKIGVLQPYLQKPLNIPAIEDEIVQMSSSRKSHKPRTEKDIELEIRILERDTIQKRKFRSRLAMRQSARNLGIQAISDIQGSAQGVPTVVHDANPTLKETPQEFERQKIALLHSTQTVTNKPDDVKDVQSQEPLTMKAPTSFNSEILQNLYEERMQGDSSTVNSKVSEDNPAVVLSKQYENTDNFRITRTENLIGNKNLSGTENLTGTENLYGQSELNIGLEEIKSIFDEEKVPLYPFVNITNLGNEKISQSGKIKSFESGINLSKLEYSIDRNAQADQALPNTETDKVRSTTDLSSDTTLTTETNDLSRNEDLSKPLVSSALIQLSKTATHTNTLQDEDKQHIETVDSSPKDKADTEFKSVTDKSTENVNAQSAEMMKQAQLQSHDAEISLSELLKRVREKSLYENLQQIMLTSQVPEVDAAKPSCTPLANPPPKTLPPKPCQPKPKKVKKEKKKFQKSTLDTLGLVVTKAFNMNIPQQYSLPKKRLEDEVISKSSTAMLVPDRIESAEDVTNFSNLILYQMVLDCIKQYEALDSPFLLIPRRKNILRTK